MKHNVTQIRVKNSFGEWLVQFQDDTNNPWESVDYGASYESQEDAEEAAQAWAENRGYEFIGVVE
jgi:hypothetical protein